MFAFIKKPPVLTGGVLLDGNGSVIARAHFDKPTASVWRGLAELQSAARPNGLCVCGVEALECSGDGGSEIISREQANLAGGDV